MKAQDKTYRYKMWLTDIICNTGPEWKRRLISQFHHRKDARKCEISKLRRTEEIIS